jgi:hypothetical protein
MEVMESYGVKSTRELKILLNAEMVPELKKIFLLKAKPGEITSIYRLENTIFSEERALKLKSSLLEGKYLYALYSDIDFTQDLLLLYLAVTIDKNKYCVLIHNHFSPDIEDQIIWLGEVNIPLILEDIPLEKKIL